MLVPRLLIWAALPILAQGPPVHPDPAAVAQRHRVASFGGTGNTSIVAMATDSAGNLYVTGTTSAPDFPVKNAAQPAMGEAQVLRTTDLGATWSRVHVPADLTSVVPDPVDPQVVFGLAGPVTYKSADGGGTWRTVNFGTPSWQTGSLAIDPGNHLRIAALGPAGVLKLSTDGGATWSPGGACPVYYCGGTLLADPTGSGTLLVQAFQPYISRDWGATFQPIQMQLSTVTFDPWHRGWIYAGTMMGVSGTVYLSTDFGATWTAKGSPPSIFSAMNGLAVDPNQPNTLVGGTGDALYRSTDGGTSWVKTSGPGQSPLVDTNGPLFFMGKGCDGLVSRVSGPGYYGIGFSRDQGAHWTGPGLSYVTGAAPGAGCAAYVTRTMTTDAFVAKLAPDGAVIWATYLGGADADAPIGIAVDAADGVYVVGNTSSLDFPVTGARLGTAGVNAVFVARLSAAGKVESSRLVGGEAQSIATGMALDALRNVWVTGRTNSQKFPVTPGVLAMQGDPNNWSGFLLKLGADLALGIASYLPGTGPSAMTVDGLGRPVVTGYGSVPGFAPPTPYGSSGFVMRLDGSSTRVLDATYLDQSLSGTAPTSVRTDAAGNLVLLGAKYTDLSMPRPVWGCHSAANAYIPIGGDIFVLKLAAADWKQVYRLTLPASCPAQPGAMVLDAAGAPVISLATEEGFPLARPVGGGPTCGLISGIVAKLKSDGSALEFATYLGGCGVSALALGRDGVPLTSTNSAPYQSSTAVLRVGPQATSISLDSIANTFSGDPGGVVLGGLYTLAVSGFTPLTADFGLHPVDPLPVSLGGMEVRFGGVAAQIVQSGPGRVVVVAPRAIAGRSTIVHGEQTTVQAWFNGVPSNAVAMPVSMARPGVLSAEFLTPLWHADPLDGYVLNDDGTLNSALNPARAGSTITLFVTGLAGSDVTLYPSWAMSGYPNATAPIAKVSPLPGFLPAVLQVKVVVDANLAGGPGGRALVGLRLQPAARPYFPPDSNSVGFYIK